MNILVTICARGGSKGIPKKNIKPFLGVPLIEYTIEQAHRFKKHIAERPGVERITVCISTDDELIYPYGGEAIEIIKRDPSLAEDHTPKVLVLKDALNKMEEKHQIKYNYLIDLDITSPIRCIEDIVGTLELCLSNPPCNTAFSVVPSRRNPYFNLVEVDLKTEIATKSKNGDFVTRQTAPRCYDMNASIYAYEREMLMGMKRSPLEGICRVHEMRETYVIDIDELEDFEVMSCLAMNGFFDYVEEIRKARMKLL